MRRKKSSTKAKKQTFKKASKNNPNILLISVLIIILAAIVIKFIFPMLLNIKSNAAFDPTYFPFGMFEDANVTNGTSAWQTMITDLKNHHLDTVLFTNNFVSRDAATLSVSDSNNFNVIFAPMGELEGQWWADTVPADITTARNVIYPLVDQLKNHSSLKGYNIKDDTPASLATKAALAVQAFHERDATHPVMPVIVGNHEKVYTESKPDVFLTYSYPVGTSSQQCDFYDQSYETFGANDYVQYLQQTTREKDPNAPLWLILQGHGGGTSGLRTPTATEAREEFWLSLGEGAKGIFWFAYSTQQFWTGIKSNTTLYNEISSLGTRLTNLKPTLLTLQKQDDLLTVTSTNTLSLQHKPYISTLANTDKSKYYIVVVNRDCNTQNLTVNSSVFQGKVKDLETSTLYNLGTAISFTGGNGKLFEVVPSNTPIIPTPVTPTNLVTNPSFESNTNGYPTGWGADPSGSYDNTVAHSGGASLKLTGPAAFTYSNQTLTLKPNTLYTYNYWVKTQNVTGSGVSTRYVELSPRTAIMPSSEWINGTNDWKQVSKSFFTPLDYQGGRFDIQWELNAGDVVWIDDLQLCEGKQCYVVTTTFPTPTAGPTATPTPTPTITPTPLPIQQGLTGQYFSNNNLIGTPTLSKVDANINFNWGTGIPTTGIPADNFSVRWTGFVTPTYSQGYSFYLKADDGVRLWVNNQKIIDKWVSLGGGETKSTTINLTAGVKYPITIEYFEKTSNALVQLSWSSTSQVKQIIPATKLSTQ